MGANDLRVLMMIHTRWSPDLGAPQPQMAIAEELRRAGDTVEKFSYEDAFPAEVTGGRGLIRYLRANRSFAARARRFVRANGRRFDVIEANQTDLPFSKSSLAFNGLLVVRSAGLIPAYERFEAQDRARWPDQISARNKLRALLSLPANRRRSLAVVPSLAAADLINVPNRDELVEVRDHMGFGSKVVHFPLGVDPRRAADLGRAAAPHSTKLSRRQIVFIGAWNPRKGSRDWPEIFRRVRASLPSTSLLLLGTTLGEQHVLPAFAPEDRQAVQVKASFRPDDLPHLLSEATVGAFPAHLEGFGLAALELMSARLPLVAYDAPGVRETVSRQTITRPVAVGSTGAFASALVAVLSCSSDEYQARATDAARVVQGFLWPDIARATRECYLARLAELGG